MNQKLSGNDQAPEADEEDEFIPEDVEDNTMPAATETPAAKPAAAKTGAAAAKSKSPLNAYLKAKLQENESAWLPRHNFHTYPQANYMRQQLLIETPSGYDGTKGTFEAFIDNDGWEFVFKIPPNDIFVEPEVIHMYHAAKYKRNFGDDSSKAHAMKTSTRTTKENWSTFRFRNAFRAEKSNDLGRVPWFDFTEITREGRKVGIVIIELKSIEPIEKEDSKLSAVTMNTFAAPAKVKGVDFSANKVAQAAAILEQCMDGGHDIGEIRKALKRAGFSGDKMLIDDEDEDEATAKRAKTS